MKGIKLLILSASLLMLISCESKEQRLAQTILKDRQLDSVYDMATVLLKKGFNAGDGYPQVWIRDLNTFLETSLKVYSQDTIRQNLLIFLRLQQPNGEIVDGYVPEGRNTWGDPHIYTSAAYTKHIGFKNTVETDQETSLVQAFAKYIRTTGDKSILTEDINGKPAIKCLEQSIDYLLRERYSRKFGLLTGATTQDWGDVQVEGGDVVDLDSLSHWSVDIYDNAMFVIAMKDMASFYSSNNKKQKYLDLKANFSAKIMSQLWDAKERKFIPHLYVKDSPFPATFNENEIYYHGGTAVAIEAGLLSREEVIYANERMLENLKKSGAPTIGLTMYPVYPDGIYKGSTTCKEYHYQNGGDWDWFGGRMIRQLIKYDLPEEAYAEMKPMLERALANKGFYEWYTKDNKPNGSAAFKGSAGVLASAIVELKEWAKENQ